MSLLQVIKIY